VSRQQPGERQFRIRPIRPQDNAEVARIIREVMTEFGAVGCNFSIADPEVDAMCEAYPAPEAAFYVVEGGGRVLGCGGMGPLAGGPPGVCELRKMYFLPELRGAGMGSRLLGLILDAARAAGYERCYLESLGSMGEARRLYLKHGFKVIDAPLGNTGHSGCNSWMVRVL
jgi:putative acetyltransferase